MKLQEFIKKGIQNFLIIFASIIIMITMLRQLYYPDMSFDLGSIYIIMFFSLLSVLVGFILSPLHNISEMNMYIRVAIHFVALETILISLAAILGIIHRASEALILALQIVVIYVILRLLSWSNDKKIAKEINEGLKFLKKEN
ncbi:DUF3021 family protein [Paenibacillus sp. UMB4589-SE434]|uniref:DUF3021 family protein n=1 Tax=Paenibacillus sp. UMB4589-SE434 TaxID=3046314 RepID=UPI00254BE77A|nr:DUF3021 family protein [Paenibacillus sp. UMB4589-SE434]MDK8183547.1 DUF3021 family protein [Paenibacillus sp. UMB4589-SE434]